MKLKHELLLSFISISLILIFSYAALTKLLDHQVFYNQLHSSTLLQPLSWVISWFIPLIELCSCILLIIPVKRRTGLWLSFTMMLAFTLYISAMLLFTSKLPCSCGGVISTMTWPQHLVFNIVFTLLAAYGLHLIRKQEIENHMNDIEEYLSRKSGDAENL